MNPVVTFTDDQLADMWLIAHERNTKRPGIRTRRFDETTADPVVNYIAVKAETAACRLLGVPFNRLVNASGGVKPGYIVGERRVLIRASGDMLIFNSAEDFDGDAAILVTPHGKRPDPYTHAHRLHNTRDVVVKGWIDRDEFLRCAVERDLGRGRRLCLRQGYLHPLAVLLNTLVGPPTSPAPVVEQLPLL